MQQALLMASLISSAISKKAQIQMFSRLSRENPRRLIDTSNMLRQDHIEAYQSGRLSVYMEDVVRRLERLQKGESEEEEKT